MPLEAPSLSFAYRVPSAQAALRCSLPTMMPLEPPSYPGKYYFLLFTWLFILFPSTSNFFRSYIYSTKLLTLYGIEDIVKEIFIVIFFSYSVFFSPVYDFSHLGFSYKSWCSCVCILYFLITILFSSLLW